MARELPVPHLTSGGAKVDIVISTHVIVRVREGASEMGVIGKTGLQGSDRTKQYFQQSRHN